MNLFLIKLYGTDDGLVTKFICFLFDIVGASTASIQKREVNTAPMNDKILNPYYVGVQSK